MKPFDIELAKTGHPVCTRDGRKARIICFDAKYCRPIVALITEDDEEIPRKYHYDGSYNCLEIPSDYDLMMASEKKTGWINIYPFQYKEKVAMTGSYAYKTHKEAKEGASDDCIATIPIEWEE